MIQARCGVPGGGKTYWGVEEAMAYMARGGVVVSNVRLSGVVDTGRPWPLRYELAPDSPVREYLRKYKRWEYQEGQYLFLDDEAFFGNWVPMVPKGSPKKHVLLLLDEVADIFDSLDKGKLNNPDSSYRKMFEFLRMHRHYFIDCIFLLQDFPTLNVRLRGLCEYVSKTVDLQERKLAGIAFRYPFPTFARFLYDKSGRVLLETKYVAKRRSVFALYESYCAHGKIELCEAPAGVDFGDMGKIKREVKKMTVLDRCFVYGGLVLLLGLVLFRGGSSRSGVVGVDVARVTVTNTVFTAAVPSSPSSRVSDGGDGRDGTGGRVSVEYQPFVFGQAGSDCWAYCRGRKYKPRQRVEFGLVVEVCKDFVRIVGDGGREHFIYPMELEGAFESSSEPLPKSAAVSVSSGARGLFN